MFEWIRKLREETLPKHKHNYKLAWTDDSHYSFQCTDLNCFSYYKILKEKFHA